MSINSKDGKSPVAAAAAFAYDVYRKNAEVIKDVDLLTGNYVKNYTKEEIISIINRLEAVIEGTKAIANEYVLTSYKTDLEFLKERLKEFK